MSEDEIENIRIKPIAEFTIKAHITSVEYVSVSIPLGETMSPIIGYATHAEIEATIERYQDGLEPLRLSYVNNNSVELQVLREGLFVYAPITMEQEDYIFDSIRGLD